MEGSSVSKKLLLRYIFLFLFVISTFIILNHTLVNYYLKKLTIFEGIAQSRNILNFISKKVEHLQAIAVDWAKWDDTYKFMQDKNSDYIKSNFEGPTLEDLNLNFFVFLDAQNHLFFGRGYDEEKKVEFTLEKLPLKLKKLIKKATFPGKNACGFFRLYKRCYLFAIHPILTSKGTGATRGYVLVAQKLSIHELKEEFPRIEFNLSSSVLSKKHFMSEIKSAKLGKVKVYLYRHRKSVLLQLLFLSKYDSSSFVLNCVLESSIISLGNFAVKVATIFNLLGFILFMLLSYFIVQKSFVQKLKKLSNSVSKIDPDQSESFQLPAFSEREFSILAKAIEDMFKKLKSEKELFQSMFNIVNSGIVIHDLKKYIFVNPYFLNLTGYSKEELYKINIFDIFHPEDKHKIVQEVTKKFQDEKSLITYEARILTRDKKVRYVIVRSAPIVYGGKKIRLASITDITLVKEAELKTKTIAYYDSITGLYNKNYLYRVLEESSRRKKDNLSTALLLVDIKNFSLINFFWGHDFGNKVLKSVAELINQQLREEDLGFRLEIDKFAVLISGQLPKEKFYAIFERIKNLLNRKITINKRDLDLKVYVAGSIYPEPTNDILKLLEHAEMALTEAKNQLEAPYVIFKKEMEEKIKERVKMEELLKAAIEHEEFFVHYQPVFSVSDRNLVQFEALIRWYCDGLKAIVSPKEFIPVAEESGLIVDITRIMIKRVCTQLAKWNDISDGKLKVALNISALDFKHPDFINFLKESVIFSNISSNQLELEITERILVENNEFSLKMLNDLKFMGFSIAIDDFGTGYSSLSYLSQFPLDVLKIDLSFVQKIGKRKEDEVIVETIINLGHSLNLKVLAEGVENEEQFEFLRMKGCDYVQGYYFSRPISSEEATKLISQYRI